MPAYLKLMCTRKTQQLGGPVGIYHFIFKFKNTAVQLKAANVVLSWTVVYRALKMKMVDSNLLSQLFNILTLFACMHA